VNIFYQILKKIKLRKLRNIGNTPISNRISFSQLVKKRQKNCLELKNKRCRAK